MNDALRLLNLLWRYGYGEIRAYRTGSRSTWAESRSDKSIQKALQRASQWSDNGWHVAAGINPRNRICHPAGRNRDVSHAIALVLDWDDKKVGNYGIQSLREMIGPPSVIVDSGRGFHAYLLLDKPENPQSASLVGKALCKELLSDPVHDPSRIMRVPGTVNPRTKTKATIMEMDESIKYRLEHIRSALPIPLQAEPSPPPSRAITDLQHSESWKRALSGDFSNFVSRSEATWHVALSLWRMGFTESDAKRTMMESALIERGEKDIERCIEKVWNGSVKSDVATFRVEGMDERANGMFLRLRSMRGSFSGQTWWQRIDGVMDHVEKCFGMPIGELVRTQARGDGAMKISRIGGFLAPRVSCFFSKV